MAGRAIRISARVVFLVCGIVSLVTVVPYAMLRGAELPVQSEWVIFAGALAIVGIFSVLAGLLPRSWIARVFRADRDDERLFSAPLKLVSAFAVVFYLGAAGAYLAPNRWNLNPQFMLALCPMYLIKMMFDPSPVKIFFLLAPMNAGVFGAVGATLGYVWMAFRSAPESRAT